MLCAASNFRGRRYPIARPVSGCFITFCTVANRPLKELIQQSQQFHLTVDLQRTLKDIPAVE
jgi:hypothetical protein